ncbi:hypothetical protein [Gracilimonas sp.]|nr:hypothetical protein [Gracilimonas sp.]
MAKSFKPKSIHHPAFAGRQAHSHLIIPFYPTHAERKDGLLASKTSQKWL